MKSFINNTCLVLFLIISLSSGLSYAASVDIKHYDITIRHNTQDSVYNVTCYMDLEKSDSVYYIQNYLTPHAIIKKIESSSESGTYDVPYRTEGRLINLTIPDEAFGDSELKITFEYTVPSPAIEDKFILEQRRLWYPQIKNDLATFKLISISRPEYITISNGDYVSTTNLEGVTHTIWQSDIPTSKITFVLAQANLYQISGFKSPKTGLEITLFSETIDKLSQVEILDKTVAMLDYFHERLGGYSYKRLNIIETPNIPGTNVSAGLMFFGPNMVDKFLQDDYSELAAMMAMQWVGYTAYPPMFGDAAWFMGLSWPQHLKMMYIRETSGDEAFASAMNVLLEQYRPIENSIDEPALLDIKLPRSEIKNKVVFGKGPKVWDLLREHIGDDKYFALIRNLCLDYKGQMFDYENLQGELNKVDLGGSGREYLHKLLTETGLPE